MEIFFSSSLIRGVMVQRLVEDYGRPEFHSFTQEKIKLSSSKIIDKYGAFYCISIDSGPELQICQMPIRLLKNTGV